MPVEDAADRAGFVDPEEFGTAATWTDGLGRTATVKGIFGNAYLENLASGDEAGIGTSQPLFRFPSTAAPEIAEGETLAIDGTLYKVAGPPEPDGLGFTTAHLHKV